MYFFIKTQFIPIMSQGKAAVKNSCSISTASLMISTTRASGVLLTTCLKSRQAKSQCRPCYSKTPLRLSSFHEKILKRHNITQKLAASCWCWTYLIPGNQFVAKCQTGHQTPLFQPEDGGKTSWEKDSFHSRKCYDSFSKCRFFISNPSKSPVGLLLDTRHCFNCVE